MGLSYHRDLDGLPKPELGLPKSSELEYQVYGKSSPYSEALPVGVPRGVVGEPSQAATVGVHHVDLEVAVPVAGECNLAVCPGKAKVVLTMMFGVLEREAGNKLFATGWFSSVVSTASEAIRLGQRGVPKFAKLAAKVELAAVVFQLVIRINFSRVLRCPAFTARRRYIMTEGQTLFILVDGCFVMVIASASQRSNPLKIKRLLRQKTPRNDCNFIPKRV